MAKNKSLLDTLNAKHKGEICFYLATDAVVGGFELEPFSGGSVSVCNMGGYTPSLSDLRTGKTIRVGHSEKLRHGTLRCYREGADIYVGVFINGQLRSRALRCRVSADDTTRIDEGMFTWFGPQEYIGTPWSDNDPNQCQVITVDHLRGFGRANSSSSPPAKKQPGTRKNTSKKRKRTRSRRR